MPERSARLGGLARLLVYERANAAGGPYFLDRFEATRADWASYLLATDQGLAVTPWGSGRPPVGTEALPVTRVTLAAARRFARWRFCRLPRLDEWRYAATGHGAYRFPWGDRFTPWWVNSSDLGLAAATNVGTFESGRDAGGAYDLFGNVAEWTESVPLRWFEVRSTSRPARVAHTKAWWLLVADSVQLHPLVRAVRLHPLQWFEVPLPVHPADPPEMDARWSLVADALQRHPLLRALPISPSLTPGFWWIAAVDRELERWLVGGHFRSMLNLEAARLVGDEPTGWHAGIRRGPREYADTIGLRIATDPSDLLAALLAETTPFSVDDLQALEQFLAVTRHRELLRAQWPRVRQRTAFPGPLVAWLEERLR